MPSRARRLAVAAAAATTVVALALALIVATDGTDASPAATAVASSTDATVAVDAEPKVADDGSAALQTTLDAWIAAQDAEYGVVVQELSGTASASSGATTSMVTASTYKLYAAVAVLAAVEQGSLALDDATALGTSVEACIEAAILVSDNDCGWAIGDVVGWSTVDAYLADLGLVATSLDNYAADGKTLDGDKTTTAADMASFLALLDDGALLSAERTAWLLDLMAQQSWRERVPAGVPDGVVVADKPGWLDAVQNDAAIVDDGTTRYVLAVYSTESTTEPLAELSAVIFAAMTS